MLSNCTILRYYYIEEKERQKGGLFFMQIPSLQQAEALLGQARNSNPGPWIAHSKVTADCAQRIAAACPDLNADDSHILGLLHDIGRGHGISGIRHVYDGWQDMNQMGYPDVARVCLTHSFMYQSLDSFMGKMDITDAQKDELTAALSKTQYNDYDRLIQLCDALAYPTGPTLLETRLVDVVLRRGCSRFTRQKWLATYQLKGYFERKTNQNIYQLVRANIGIEYAL
ncbi:HD domain-containing protein [Caproicibacterium lactatifermentans]|uniref:HD domain-containing protein n=2 Tax=Oscillospiraceae TaxID=216572 RepID=A0A859DPV5_9FIRM|nr:HD domain-containing protein [Caproicibacterium lactatifermentans]QKO29849.1 HD domain-containing protein [Caproicibacterium lactatifermentans]